MSKRLPAKAHGLPTMRPSERKEYVLDRIRHGETNREAMSRLGITEQNIDRWRADPEFDAAYLDADAIGRQVPNSRRGMRGAIPAQMTLEMRIAVLSSLRSGKSRSRACEDAGCPYTRFKYYMANDEDFVAEVLEAEEAATDRLEESAYSRATDGVTRFKYNKDGEEIGREQVYSDGLAEFLLSGRRRNRYGRQVALTGADGGPVKTLGMSMQVDAREAAQVYLAMMSGKAPDK